jgi:hypothetical protein
MTILETIEEANESADIRTFRFANLQEFNAFMDSFSFDEYPINILVPFTDNGTWVGGRRKGVIPLQGWVLTKITEESVNIRSKSVEEHYIAPMRALAKKFIFSVINSDLTDSEVEPITDSIKPEYAFLNQRAFGVSYTMNWPFSESVPC